MENFYIVLIISILTGILVTVRLVKNDSWHQQIVDTINKFSNVNAEQLEYRKLKEKPKFTKDYIEFVRNFCNDQTYIEFEQFVRSMDMSKVNRPIMEKFIDETAKEIRGYIIYSSFDSDMLLVHGEYVDKLIVDSVVHTTRTLLEKTTDEYSII